MVTAIPIIDPSLNGRDIPIHECGESIEGLEAGDRIFVSPAYHARGFTTASNEIRLRRRVIAALRRAATLLRPDVGLVVWDGLRSLATQGEIGSRFAASLRRLPLNDIERQSLLDRFVSPLPPSRTYFERNPPPHTTGGAVDVSLCDLAGNPLNMGAEFDQFDSAADLRYFEEDDEVASTTVEACLRRRLLYWAMIGAGFAPYGPEYWHFEYATQRASAFHGHSSANYGYAVPWEDAEARSCV